MGTLLRVITLCKIIPFPLEKGTTLKGKNLTTLKGKNLLGSKFIPFRVGPFQKVFGVQESKQEVAKIVSLLKNWQKIYHTYLIPLIRIFVHSQV